MNPTTNTSGNPYGLSNAPIASTPLVPTTPPPTPPVPPRLTLDSVKPVTVPAQPAPVPTPVAANPTPTPTPAPLPPAPVLPIESVTPDTSNPATPPVVPAGPAEPTLTPAELSVAQLEVEPDTSPTGTPTTSSAFASTPPTTFTPPAAEPTIPLTPPDSPVQASVGVDTAPTPPAFFGDAKQNAKGKSLAAIFKIDFKNFHISRMAWIIIGGVVALLVIGALVYFVLLPMLNTPKTADTTKTNDTTQNETPTETSATVSQSVIDDVNNVYNGAVTDEASTAGTDDTSYATDASNSAANVGNSVNEANF